MAQDVWGGRHLRIVLDYRERGATDVHVEGGFGAEQDVVEVGGVVPYGAGKPVQVVPGLTQFLTGEFTGVAPLPAARFTSPRAAICTAAGLAFTYRRSAVGAKASAKTWVAG
ncbi:hypothetical protein [Streptomyces virginiae]|uniref:hypothetical protein n=1 Tax=Streptomyces virginiae TaxID=1961 RepID=UPI003331989E